MGLWSFLTKPAIKRPWPPQGPGINLYDIAAGDSLLFLRERGNVTTQKFGTNWDECPHHPEFHATPALGRGEHMNVGLRVKRESIEEEFRSSTRIDVVRYTQVTEEQRKRIRAYILEQEGDFYAFAGYVGFLAERIPGIRKAWKNDPALHVCSALNAHAHAHAESRISSQPWNLTAPWDLRLFAVSHPPLCEIRTLWVGNDLGGRGLLA